MTLNKTNRPITQVERDTLSLLKKNPYISIAELAVIIERSEGTTYDRLKRLQKKGYIDLTGKARGIKVLR